MTEFMCLCGLSTAYSEPDTMPQNPLLWVLSAEDFKLQGSKGKNWLCELIFKHTQHDMKTIQLLSVLSSNHNTHHCRCFKNLSSSNKNKSPSFLHCYWFSSSLWLHYGQQGRRQLQRFLGKTKLTLKALYKCTCVSQLKCWHLIYHL